MLQERTIGLHDGGTSFLPAAAPIAMPQQSLWDRRGRALALKERPRRLLLRRIAVIGATAVMTVVAAREMYEVLEVGGLTVPESLVLAIFVLLFAWVAMAFVSNVIGFAAVLGGANKALGIDADSALPSLRSRTALLLPTYNENVNHVFARLQAICESVAATGQSHCFDFFILSDSTDPRIWIAEEIAFCRLREKLRADNIFYRHRKENTARKAGNIADWVTNFGAAYDHMIILDADSLMTGDAIVRLAGAMEHNPAAGLIQTLPVLVNGNTLFARMQQFAGRLYGPLVARGIAWWHGSEGNYWGHNAVIRVEAFASQAGLPTLRGRKPFGGDILSHDFVEAALLRRGGWGVYMAPSLEGSFEESPPTVLDYALRDRRWCQGNLQHASVLFARGLHWMSRMHLMVGIGSYITAPLWLSFLLLGIVISLQARFVRPEYFPSGATLFPQWPAQDPVRAAWVFAGTMALLLIPKLLGFIAAAVGRSSRFGMGGALRGFCSVVFEVLLSALVAPVMMVEQAKAILEILAGRDAGWQPQTRSDGSVPFAQLAWRYKGPTLLGVLMSIAAYAISWPLLLWMSPVIAGLLLAIPLAALTGSPSVGRRLRAAGLLWTQDERRPPAILLRANEIAAAEAAPPAENPFVALAREPRILDQHYAALKPETGRVKGRPNENLVIAIARMADFDSIREASDALSDSEVRAVLNDRRALATMMSKAAEI